MAQVVIENPILNSPFIEPARHFLFDDDGITNEIISGRRVSSYFVPIPRAKKRGKQQLSFDTEWTQDRIEENVQVNRIRQRVNLWRQGGYPGVTPTTARLLQYWTDPDRERKLFFCQIEALETAIYITEVARKYGDPWIDNFLVEANAASNPGLPRQALKMATGAGKTVVMAMLIAWHALNKLANSQDPRFSDTFLVIAPGITIRDRLRVLLPSDPQNYYRERDLIPAYQMAELGQAKILIRNFHAFQLREKQSTSKLTKALLGDGRTSPFLETPGEMVRRVCREFGPKKHIIVLNDEAHHCYRRKPDAGDEKLTGDDRIEARKRDEEARIWISGIEAVKAKIGIKTIYDLSATPFFLRGSGYSEGTLFPWVISDFSLIDAIESGIVKVPRVPIADDSMISDLPVYRDLWLHIRDHLPKKGRKTDSVAGQEPNLPRELEGALQSLYSNYKRSFDRWEQQEKDRPGGSTPPVFIVVCNNTNVSKMVFDYIAGWEKQVGGQIRVQAGELELFRNDDAHGNWLHRPNTILVDSQQLESGEAMSDDFKRIAAREIEEFKADYRLRFPGRDAADLTDEDLLREVMNTVGKKGRLGEHVRCVVSVSMLTEGWDANTVTHILGVRAFGTQLLCEQVVGRALRRMSYAPNAEGLFEPEYAEVYGVPFSFIPSSGSTGKITPGPTPTRVRALEIRERSEITYPRLLGYRHEIPEGPLVARFDDDSIQTITTRDQPGETTVGSMIGEEARRHRMYGVEGMRPNEIAFHLTKRTLDKYFQDVSDVPSPANGAPRTSQDKPWYFPQLLAITKRWMKECVILHDNTAIQWLYLADNREEAVDRIYRSIIIGSQGTPTLLPILRPYDPLGSTRYVDFDTTKPVWRTDPEKCHVTHVVADTGTWEQKLAQTLEAMPEVVRYAKNEGLGFTIPYTHEGVERHYLPDFIVCLDDGHGPDDLRNLIIEVTGEQKKDKIAKTRTARDFWVPAVNHRGAFGRWSFLEITDPWNAATTIRAHLAAHAASPPLVTAVGNRQ